MNRTDYALYFRTARYLRWSQLLWRLWYSVERRAPGVFRAMRGQSDVPEMETAKRRGLPAEPFASDATGVRLFNEIRHGQLTCSNLALPFHSAHPDWRLGPQSQDRLPAVTLHYHRWLFELLRFAEKSHDPMRREANETAMHLLDDWIDQCGEYNETTRHLAWNSYAIATRIGWWVRILHLAETETSAWNSLRSRMEQCLWRQCEHLHQHIEWDLRANHLFRDAVGLAWGANFFSGAQSERWRRTATRIALSQIDEQVLPDGCHFERSPMYHLEWMHDLATLANLLGDDNRLVEKASWTLEKMKDAVNWMIHPDGTTIQWNDGRRCKPADECGEWKESLGTDSYESRRGGRWLGHSGWAVWRGDPFHVFFDVGSVGPSCQPGHAHAGALAVECSFQGQRLFVDPGNLNYDQTQHRKHERSTAAHNTVACNRANSSEVWHVFRVGRRAQVANTRVFTDNETMRAVAEHDGFSHQADQPLHQRQVEVGHGTNLSIRDLVRCRNERPSSEVHHVEGGWLLEPGWKAEATPCGWRLERANVEPIEVVLEGPDSISLSVENAAVCPNYHDEQPTSRLTWRWSGRLPFELRTVVRQASSVDVTTAAPTTIANDPNAGNSNVGNSNAGNLNAGERRADHAYPRHCG